MSLPLAHGLLGATVIAASIQGVSVKRDWRALFSGGAVAVFPDVDYLFYLGLGLGESWHRSFSHSILFAIVLGVVASALRNSIGAKDILLYSLATLSHSLLDALTTARSGGVELFWPFSTGRIRFGILDYHELLTQHRPLADILRAAFLTSLLELVVFGPVFLATLMIRRKK